MPQHSAFPGACLLIIFGTTSLVLANVHGNSSMAPTPFKQVAQSACNPRIQRCCFMPDNTPVPPGTRQGPYTCLPNGTWG